MPLTQRARRFIYLGVGLIVVLIGSIYALTQSTSMRSWFLQTPSQGLTVKNVSWDRWQTNSSQLIFYNVQLQASWRQQDVVIKVDTLTLEGWGQRIFGRDWQSIHLDRAVLEFISTSPLKNHSTATLSMPSDWRFFIDQLPANFSFPTQFTIDQFRTYQNNTLMASGEVAFSPDQINAKWVSPHTHIHITKKPNENLEIIANRMNLGLRLETEFKNLQFDARKLSAQIELSPKWLGQPKNTLAVLPGQIQVYPVEPIFLKWHGQLALDLSQADLIHTSNFNLSASVKNSNSEIKPTADIIKLEWNHGKWQTLFNIPINITGSTEGLSGLAAKLFPHWTNDFYKLFNTYEIKADQQVDTATPTAVSPSALWKAHFENIELQGDDKNWTFKTTKEGEWQLKNMDSDENSIIATIHALEIEQTNNKNTFYWQGYLQDVSNKDFAWNNLFHRVKLQQLKNKLTLDWSGDYTEESNGFLARINASRLLSETKFKIETNITSEKISENLLANSIFLPVRNEMPKWFTAKEYQKFAWHQEGETEELWKTLKSPTQWQWQTEKLSFNQSVWHPMQWKNIGFENSAIQIQRDALAKSWIFEVKSDHILNTAWIKNIQFRGEILNTQDPFQFQIDEASAEFLNASLVLHQPWNWSAEKNELPARFLLEKLSIQQAAEAFGFPRLKSDLTVSGVLPLFLTLEKNSKQKVELQPNWKIQRGLFSEETQGKELIAQALLENTEIQQIPDMVVDRMRAEVNILETSNTPVTADINAQISGSKKFNSTGKSESSEDQAASDTEKDSKPITLNLNHLKVPLVVDSTEDLEMDPLPQSETEPTRSE